MNLPARTAVPADLANPTPPGASRKQVAYMIALLVEREVKPETEAALTPKLAAQEAANAVEDCFPEPNGISKRRASEVIGKLMELPKKQQTKPAAKGGSPIPGLGRFPVRFEELELDGGKKMELGFVGVNGKEVPQGKYALDTSADERHVNDVEFFNLYVAHGADGPFYSLKMYVSDDLVKLPNARQREVLERIAEDPAAASAMYGAHRTRCGVCNRKLTNDDSRARGIGPVCADRLGW